MSARAPRTVLHRRQPGQLNPLDAIEELLGPVQILLVAGDPIRLHQHRTGAVHIQFTFRPPEFLDFIPSFLRQVLKNEIARTQGIIQASQIDGR